MTHNVYDKGQPTGQWATAARSPQGVFGVTVGVGAEMLFFIPEDQLGDYLAAALKVGGDEFDSGITATVADAAATLDQFKRDYEKRQRQAAAASGN